MEKKFSPHLELAKTYWKNHLTPGDLVIDATCGNGHDTLFLAQICNCIGLDIQEKAIQNTRALLEKHGQKAELLLMGHEKIDTLQVLPSLIVYNLGYLPQADKSLTTKVASTLESIEKGMEMLGRGGALSITCYPGHEEGEREEIALTDFIKALSPLKWAVCHHRWLNRPKSPSLLWLLKL